MWVVRYFIPGIILVAFGIFLGSNLNQKTSIQFLTWGVNEVPLILIVAVAFVIGVLVRYYVLFLKWMNKMQMARMKKRILSEHAQKPEKTLKPEKEYSESMEDWAEEETERRIAEDKERVDEDNENK